MDEELRALYWAMHHLPPAPEHVEKASRGQSDLWHRIKSEPYRPLTRDEKRLDQHYQAVRDAYVAEVVEAFRNH
jgi:hypothetical protein